MKKFLVYFASVLFLCTLSLSVSASLPSIDTKTVIQSNTTEITYDDLPDAVKTALQDDQYKDWKIEHIFKISNDEYAEYYSIEFTADSGKQVVNFDAEGNVVQ